MGTPLNELLAVLATAKGSTMLAKIDFLINAGHIFTSPVEPIRVWAQAVDGMTDMQSMAVEHAGCDVQAFDFARRLNAVYIRTTAEDIRRDPSAWPEHAVKQREEEYQRRYVESPRRKKRFSAR